MSDKLLSKEEHIINYVKSLAAIEDHMEPFKEHRRDLRKSYSENGWLTKDEIRVAVKAYRLVRGEIDIDALKNVYKQISGQIGG